MNYRVKKKENKFLSKKRLRTLIVYIFDCLDYYTPSHKNNKIEQHHIKIDIHKLRKCNTQETHKNIRTING